MSRIKEEKQKNNESLSDNDKNSNRHHLLVFLTNLKYIKCEHKSGSQAAGERNLERDHRKILVTHV